MAKKACEEGAKDRFLKHMECERGEEWEVSAEDFVPDPGTRMDFDYQLRLGSKRIALEIMRLVDGRSLAKSVALYEISTPLGAELMRRGVKDVTIWTPSFNVPKAHRRQFVQEVADKLEPVAKSCTRKVKVRVNEYIYTVDPSPGIGSVFFVCPNGYYSDPGGQLLQLISALRQKLPHKNRELSITGHERIVLLVSLEGMIKTEDVREAISNIDFSCLPNIDRVYFESGMERINLVYDRSVTVRFA